MIMSDATANKAIPVLQDSDEVPFTYPEGYQAMINSLDFLPENKREAALTAMMMRLMGS
jgi:hypothetical protein